MGTREETGGQMIPRLPEKPYLLNHTNVGNAQCVVNKWYRELQQWHATVFSGAVEAYGKEKDKNTQRRGVLWHQYPESGGSIPSCRTS